MIGRIEHDSLDLENGVDGDHVRWALVGGDEDSNVADAGLVDETVELFAVLGID